MTVIVMGIFMHGAGHGDGDMMDMFSHGDSHGEGDSDGYGHAR